MTLKKSIFLYLFFTLLMTVCSSKWLCAQNQESKAGLCIIDNIAALESAKDPKCHATANRLEDFMYGTPLSDEARIMKTDLQKRLLLYVWDAANRLAEQKEMDTIELNLLNEVAENLNRFGKLKDGNWFVETVDGRVLIESNDLRQYSSVAYALRAMLSIEQDFLFNPSWALKPLDDEAVDALKLYTDLVTLASLKLADQNARAQNAFVVSATAFEKAWSQVMSASKARIFLDSDYPEHQVRSSPDNNFATLDAIIEQKIKSYSLYNEISLPILLRNIQVYFARHRWPADEKKSDELKSYLIESMVYFCSELIRKSSDLASEENFNFIRAEHINQVIPSYLPIEINAFEDVIYFPESDETVMIESYDLDAFRDSGIHWLILSYALEDMDKSTIKEPDPFSAEIIVEAVAQMSLLVLRITGDISVSRGHSQIALEDMTGAFVSIQEMIKSYPELAAEKQSGPDSSIRTSGFTEKSTGKVFNDATARCGIDFMHKSSDWLSRLIRSYVVKKDENLIRMAIPPAFGGSGVAAEDINNDNWPDLVFLGGMGVKVYLNDGRGGFDDISQKAGIDIWNADKNSYSEPRQIIVADFDNDGWQDIFISLVHDRHKLYRNVNGLVFEDVSDRAKLGGDTLVAGPATALDFDKDGLLDLYIGNFGNYMKGELPSLSRNNQNGSPNCLFRNMGQMSFTEVRHVDDAQADFGWTQAVGHTDINQDGWQDIIVGNDFGVNAYYINQKDGTFRNENKALQTDKPSYTMNVGSTDLNGDMFPDLYISNIVVMEKDEKYVNPSGNTRMNFELEKMENIRTVEANDLFISNSADGKLINYTKSNRIGRGYSSTGWSWDADFFDFDNDGDEDLYCLNGMNDFRVYGAENPYYNSPEGESREVLFAQSNRERNNFFVNENGMLIDRAEEIGGDLVSNSRSAAYLDYDNDGDLDIAINNYHDKAVFLQNDQETGFNWIKIRLKGSPENKVCLDAVGSNLMVYPEGSSSPIWREIKSTTGYLSVHPKTQHFGLGKSNYADITVKWSDGRVETFPQLEVNREYLISYTGDIQLVVK